MRSAGGEPPTDRPPEAETSELLRQALLALERRIDDGDPGRRAAGRADRLRDSASLLADAFDAARGRGTGARGTRRATLSEHPVVDAAATSLLLDLLDLHGRGEWHQERVAELDDLERRYRSTLPAYRSALAREVPGYAGIRGLCRRVAASRALIGVLATSALAAAALAGIYRVLDPHYIFEQGGQIFWSRSPGEPYLQQRSRRFDVRVDGAPHQYTVSFTAPIRISGLRVDPVNSDEVTGVDILAVRLLVAGGGGATDVTPGGETSWSCANCRWVSREPGAWRLRPLNDDPHIEGSPPRPVEATGVEIELRAAAKKTFWEWATRLEKNH